MIGQTLGHYRVLEKVAAGGMGVVYRAHDEQLERDVAVKVLPSGTLSDDAARRHFRREAMALAKLNHPHIETVYEFGTQDDVDFLVMEYVPGKTLAERLSAGALPEKEIVELGMQIASALQEAHERGIVHRDLKPANIAITAKGYAKVLDFGLAKLLRPVDEGTTEVLSNSRAAAGTLPYMPPEQLKGERVDARADIYTIGAVLYEMATGLRAFREELPSRLIDAILHQPVVVPRALNPRISPELETIILKCLDKDADRRYQAAKELLVDLRRLQRGSFDVPMTLPPAHSSVRWRRFAYAMAAALVLASGLVASNVAGLRDRLLGHPRTPQIRSIAVLPFDNLSNDPDQDYFADGMTEDLITNLGQIHTLRVISRTSVTRYKSAREPLTQIARELNVDAIVEGSVSRSEKAVQVTAHLLYGPTDTQLWSKSYKRDLQNVLALQADVAGAIVHEIDLTLTPQEQERLAGSGQINPRAHEAYLRGNYLLWGTQEQKQKAKQYFEQALSIDPNYAPAYAGLADYYWKSQELDPRVAMPQAEQYALRALQLDPLLAHAHLALGGIRFYGDWDWEKANAEFQRAIELNPSDSEAHRVYAYYLSALGRAEDALAEIRRAQELDPLHIATQITAGWVSVWTRHYDQAILACKKALELDANSAGAYDCLGNAYLAEGAYEQAIEACRQAATLSGNSASRLVGLGRAYALAGKNREARAVFREVHDLSLRAYVPPFFLAELHLAFGEKKEALNRLEEAYGGRDRYIAWLKVERALDPLRADARFQGLLHRVGLSSP